MRSAAPPAADEVQAWAGATAPRQHVSASCDFADLSAGSGSLYDFNLLPLDAAPVRPVPPPCPLLYRQLSAIT